MNAELVDSAQARKVRLSADSLSDLLAYAASLQTVEQWKGKLPILHVCEYGRFDWDGEKYVVRTWHSWPR